MGSVANIVVLAFRSISFHEGVRSRLEGLFERDMGPERSRIGSRLDCVHCHFPTA